MTFGDIIKTIAPPALNPAGIAFNGKNLLVACGGDGNIHEIDRQTGSSVRSFPYIGIQLGLECLEDGRLLQGNGTNLIYLTDLQGNLIRTFPGINTYVYGITDTEGGIFIQTAYDTVGALNSLLIYREFSRLAPEIRRVNTAVGLWALIGLCFDGKDLYAGRYTGVTGIMKFSIDGELIEQAAFPDRPMGVTFDGKNLWVTNDVTDLIYCMSVN